MVVGAQVCMCIDLYDSAAIRHTRKQHVGCNGMFTAQADKQVIGWQTANCLRQSCMKVFFTLGRLLFNVFQYADFYVLKRTPARIFLVKFELFTGSQNGFRTLGRSRTLSNGGIVGNRLDQDISLINV